MSVRSVRPPEGMKVSCSAVCAASGWTRQAAENPREDPDGEGGSEAHDHAFLCFLAPAQANSFGRNMVRQTAFGLMRRCRRSTPALAVHGWHPQAESRSDASDRSNGLRRRHRIARHKRCTPTPARLRPRPDGHCAKMPNAREHGGCPCFRKRDRGRIIVERRPSCTIPGFEGSRWQSLPSGLDRASCDQLTSFLAAPTMWLALGRIQLNISGDAGGGASGNAMRL